MDATLTPLTPAQFLSDVEDALPRSAPEERVRLLQHARAWALTTFAGVLPPALSDDLTRLETTWR